MMETTLLLAAVARRFRMESVSGLALQPWATMTLRPPSGVWLRLRLREGAAE